MMQHVMQVLLLAFFYPAADEMQFISWFHSLSQIHLPYKLSLSLVILQLILSRKGIALPHCYSLYNFLQYFVP